MDMELYLDTAEIGEIEEASRWGVLGGVTTNPTLMYRAGHADPESAVRKIAELLPEHGTVSMECVATDADGMIEEGRRYMTWSDKVLVKCPCTSEGLAATAKLATEGARVNMTLIFSPMQAILAAKAGAWCASPFAGRLDDIASDGMQLVADMADIYRTQGYSTKVLAASLRHPMHVVEAARSGADIATMPFKVFEQLVRHPLTDAGLAAFLSDWRQLQEQTGQR